MSNDDHYDDQPKRESKSEGKRPSHVAFQVRENEDGKAYFNRIGSAWPHKDGEGFSLLLDATPIDGRVTLRTPQERLEETRDDQSRSNRGDQRQRDPGFDLDR